MSTIPQLFQYSVEHFGKQLALCEPTEGDNMTRLTYEDVRAQVNGFAGYLQQQHIQKGDRLLIWSGSRIDWLIAYLGTLLVGGVVVPLDVQSKEDFLARIADVTESKLLVTTYKLYNGLKHPPLPLVDLDHLPTAPFDPAALPDLDENDLAELVFTSGTTGQPKGVMLSHNNIVSNATTAVKRVHVRFGDRALSILPLSHMFEMTIDIAILYVGGTIVYSRSLSPDTLLKLFASQRITCMVLVPQALQLFLNGIEREVRRRNKEKQWEMLHRIAPYVPFGLRRYLFATVHKRLGGFFRFFVSGGAYLAPKLAQRWENMGVRVIQGYGATECAPIISVSPHNEHVLDSVGKPLPDVTVQIADDHEILVHGPNVAQGYWKNPEATQAAFQDGWYHTGDLGYFDDRGFLYLKGRKKNLIVLANGMNVYPEDVENALTSLPGVKDAVVFGLNEREQGPEVHSVLLVEDPNRAKAVVQQANRQLASHQQIKGFTVWPEADFPRTHTLKVKRQEVLSTLETIRTH